MACLRKYVDKATYAFIVLASNSVLGVVNAITPSDPAASAAKIGATLIVNGFIVWLGVETQTDIAPKP